MHLILLSKLFSYEFTSISLGSVNLQILLKLILCLIAEQVKTKCPRITYADLYQVLPSLPGCFLMQLC